jgi:hypothetical protein
MTDLATKFFDEVACVDYETFWDKGYTLQSKTQSMTEYIRDPRFEAQAVAVQLSSWPDPQVAIGKEIPELLHEVDWSVTAMLGHHTQFDGLISTHHFNVTPVFWLDTMGLSRAIYGADVPHGLDALGQRAGVGRKQGKDILDEIRGLYLADMTPEQIEYLRGYNGHDARLTLDIYRKLWQYLPFEELRIIDATIRMYCEPLLLLDEERLKALHGREVTRRAKLAEDAETTAKVLGSAPKFADLLRSLGVVPPMKISPTTGQPTYAFAKTDLEFKRLLEHPDEAVRKAVEARLGSKGSIVETRSKRLLSRTGLPTPVYLSYAAARTLRWGGGDLANWQNLPSTGDGANLRRAILAPPGTKIIGADASQVEARMTGWLSEFVAKLEAFVLYDQGQGPDMYCISAEGAFGRPIDKYEDPFERFLGKVLELSCQYGAGAVRTKSTLAQGFRGAEPVLMELHEVKAMIARWRKANKPICDYWSRLERAVKQSWAQGVESELGPLHFEHVNGTGYIHMPNGTYIRYPGARYDAEMQQLYYISKNGRTDIWGGHLLENVSQALCCALLKHHMIQILDEMPDLRMVLLVHDEIVSLAEEDVAEERATRIKEIMSVPAPWAQGLPLNADVKIGDYYDKA